MGIVEVCKISTEESKISVSYEAKAEPEKLYRYSFSHSLHLPKSGKNQV